MASRYTPTYRYMVDFERDDYQSDTADLTPYHEDHATDRGCAANPNGSAVSAMSSEGLLLIHNSDGRYDPHDSRAVVDETKLRRRNPAKIEADGRIVWQGQAHIGPRVGADADALISVILESRYDQVARPPGRELYRTGLNGTDLAAAFTAESGIPLEADSEQPTGIVPFSGSWLVFLDQYARYFCGFNIETDNGWKFVRYADTPDMPVAATLPLRLGSLYESQIVDEQVGHIRNHAECRSMIWETLPNETLLAAESKRIARLQQTVAELVVAESRGLRPLGWTRFEVTPANVVFKFNESIIDNYNARVSAQSLDYAGSVPQTVVFRGYGNAGHLTESQPFDLNITDYGTQEVFGKQTLWMPAWFPADFAGASEFTRPFLRNLSQAPEISIVEFNERQATAADSHLIIDNLREGNAVNVEVETNSGPRTIEGLVLNVKHLGTRNGPKIRRAALLTRRATPPPPIVASVSDLTDRSAHLHAQVPSPAFDQLYARRRTT